MDRPSPLAVAPAWHDEGTGNDSRPLRARPAHRFEKFVGPIGIPVGEHQLCLRRQGVQRLGTQDAMLTVLRLQASVTAEGTDRDLRRQTLAQKTAIAAKAGIENGDFNPLAANA